MNDSHRCSPECVEKLRRERERIMKLDRYKELKRRISRERIRSIRERIDKKQRREMIERHIAGNIDKLMVLGYLDD